MSSISNPDPGLEGGKLPEGELPSSVASGSRLAPSGDITGATDTAAIKALLEKGGCSLGRGPSGEQVFWVNEQIVVPDGTAGTPANGFLIGLGKDQVTIRQAAGANIAGPIVTTSNLANNVGSNSLHPVTIEGFTVDVNAQNQTYTSVPEPDAAWGPDGLAVWNDQGIVDEIRVVNPMRHGIVQLDETPNGTKAASTGWDSRFGKLYVDGYFFSAGITPPSLVCATTRSGKEVITAESVAAIKVGMVVVGNGIAPNTTVAKVEAGKITLSQNSLISEAAVTLQFGYGQRAFWNANLSSHGACDGYVESIVARGLFGDFVVKSDNTGDWNIGDCHTYSCAYSGGKLTFANNSLIHNNGFDNFGQIGGTPTGASMPMAKTTAAFTGGEKIEVEALPVAIKKNTLLVMRTAGPGGGPLYLATKADAAVGATSLSVYYVKPPSEVAKEVVIYRPLVGLLILEGLEANNYGPNRVGISEKAGADYVYLAILGGGFAGQETNLGSQRNQNFGSEEGTTSSSSVFISTSANTWSIRGAGNISTSGKSAIKTRFQANGHNEAPFLPAAGQGLIQFVDGAPGSHSVPAGTRFSYVCEGATHNGEWTVPTTGVWRLRAHGGGGQGGGGASPATNVKESGGGGGAAGCYGEQLVQLTAGTVLKFTAGAGGSAAGAGATAGAGAGENGSSGSKSLWQNSAETAVYAMGAGGAGGAKGTTTGSNGGIPGGEASATYVQPGAGGFGNLGGNGGKGGPALGGMASGGGAGGGAAETATKGGTKGAAGAGYQAGSASTQTNAAGGENGKAATAAGEEGESAAAGSGAGGGGGGAGAWNGGGGSQGVGGKGGAGGGGWVDALLVG